MNAPIEGGILYVVATPIGNLGDVTLRALEILRSVALIAAEDTRIARRLLTRYDIPTRTTSYHAQSDPGRREALLAYLRTGADLALVTDAGTPVISDPGEDLVAAWAAEGGRVVPLPGASAVLAAVPRRGRERRERLSRIAADDRATVVFEAANRLAATLGDLALACGPDRPGAVCRELTKLHEQVARGSLSYLETAVRAGAIPTRGEVVVVIGAADQLATATATPGAPALEAALAAVDGLVAGGLGRAEAARRVAAETGLPRRALYRVK